VRRGAASCQSSAAQLPVTAAAGVATAEPSPVAEPQTLQPERGLRRPAGGRRPVRVLRPPCRQTSVQRVGRTSGVQASGVRCPGVQCPVSRRPVSECPDRHARPVSAAAASALSTPRWIPGRRCGRTGHVRRSGFDVPPWGRRAGWCRCPHRARREGWSYVGSAWLAAGSTADLSRCLVCVQAEAPRSPPGRPRTLV
jgi:hypothetical protein